MQTTAYQDSYWSNPKDPHVSQVTKTLTESQIQSIYPANSPAYSVVLKENIYSASKIFKTKIKTTG